MSKCHICGKSLLRYSCEDCDKLYLSDVEAKRYPQAFIDAGIVPTRLEWEKCRIVGIRAGNRMGNVQKDVKDAIEHMAQCCIDNRTRKAEKVADNSEQRRVEKEKKLNKHYPY